MALAPLPPEERALVELRGVTRDTQAQRSLLARFRDGQRLSVATNAAPNEPAVMQSNLAVSLAEPGYRDIHQAHLRQQCYRVSREELPRDSALFLGLEGVDAWWYLSCPVGRPLLGAISVSFDYPDAPLDEAEEVLKAAAPNLEPLLLAPPGNP